VITISWKNDEGYCDLFHLFGVADSYISSLYRYRAEPGAVDLDYVLREVYILYADCALKDPFYELEMPIRCELFTQAVDALIQKVEKSSRSR
jgi:hypothetical protein